MRIANVFVRDVLAGQLIEHSQYSYEFIYDVAYSGQPVSLTMPLKNKKYSYSSFPSFFEGLLPEGIQLESLLRTKKINRGDLFGQLMACGSDCVGAVTVQEQKI